LEAFALSLGAPVIFVPCEALGDFDLWGDFDDLSSFCNLGASFGSFGLYGGDFGDFGDFDDFDDFGDFGDFVNFADFEYLRDFDDFECLRDFDATEVTDCFEAPKDLEIISMCLAGAVSSPSSGLNLVGGVTKTEYRRVLSSCFL